MVSRRRYRRFRGRKEERKDSWEGGRGAGEGRRKRKEGEKKKEGKKAGGSYVGKGWS